jgi:hypothetical protein
MLTVTIALVAGLIIASTTVFRKAIGQFKWGMKEGAKAAEEGRKPDLSNLPTELRFGNNS